MNQMKKKIIFPLVSILTLAVLLSGCGKSSTSSSASSTADTTIPYTTLLKTLDYNVSDYVKLGNYMGVAVTVTGDYDVTEAKIKSYAAQVISGYPSYTKTSKKTVEKNDTVNIDYVGKIDGKTFDGGSATGTHLKIGSGTFITGFEDGLKGKKVGSTVTLNLKFPSNYSANTSVAGKKVVFTVKINYIEKSKAMTYDKLTDAYVKANFASSGIETVKAFKAQLKTEVQSSQDSQKKSDLQSAVLKKLETICTVKFPDGLLAERVKEQKEELAAQCKSAGTTIEKYVKQSYSMSLKKYYAQMETTTKENLKQELILQAIVKDQKTSITTTDFKSFVTQCVSYYGYSSTSAFYKAYGGEDAVKLSYAETQALSTVANAAKATYKSSTSK